MVKCDFDEELKEIRKRIDKVQRQIEDKMEETAEILDLEVGKGLKVCPMSH